MVIAFFELREIGIFEHFRLREKAVQELEGGVRRSIISFPLDDLKALAYLDREKGAV